MPEDDRQRWDAWRSACRRDEIVGALSQLYAGLDQAVADYGPTCWSSGKCCKFESYGHRLYVTGLEIAYFHQRRVEVTMKDTLATAAGELTGRDVRLDQVTPVPLADACRYQVEGKCSVHAIRPLGCRIFFCQEGTDDWQQQTYEAFQRELMALHESHAIPYHYMEWRAGLIEADRHLATSA